MSSRALRKRRHRSDFGIFVQERKVARLTGAPMWQRAGFPTNEAFQHYLANKPKDGQIVLPATEHSTFPKEHVHGPNCGHSSDLPQSEADTMTDEQWVEETRLTKEEKEAFTSADSEEGETF